MNTITDFKFYLDFNFHEYIYQFLFLFPDPNSFPYHSLVEIDLESNTTWVDLTLESMYNHVEEEDETYKEINKQTFGYYDVEIGEYVL